VKIKTINFFIYLPIFRVCVVPSYRTAPAPKLTQPDPVVPKARTRSQLEAARARFFAELMQTSDIFKDTPSQSLSFSSDSLNAETSTSTQATNTQATDPFHKYLNKSAPKNNNHIFTSTSTVTDNPEAAFVHLNHCFDSSA